MLRGTMYLRTAALVLLVSLALSSAAEDPDAVEVTISNYAPQVYASGSCAMRRRMYQEQYYYGSAEDQPYAHHVHHEHSEGYKGQHHDRRHDGYGSEATAQGKAKVASKDKVGSFLSSLALLSSTCTLLTILQPCCAMVVQETLCWLVQRKTYTL